jgi:hypothetical protein
MSRHDIGSYHELVPSTVHRHCFSPEIRLVVTSFLHVSPLTFVRIFWFYFSVVGVATGYGLDDRGVGIRVPVGSSIFTSPYRPDRLWVHPASYAMDTGGKAARA